MYLLGDDGAGIRFDKYIMNSLVAERELLQDIQSSVKRRADDELWPIEIRMRRSVEATAKAAGVNDVSSLPARARIGFPNAEARIKLLGPTAYAAYRMGSVETHGDWNDLFRNHLRYEDGVFSPNLDSLHVRPQSPLLLTILSMTTISENVERVIEDAGIANFVHPYLVDLVKRTTDLDVLHEKLLQS